MKHKTVCLLLFIATLLFSCASADKKSENAGVNSSSTMDLSEIAATESGKADKQSSTTSNPLPKPKEQKLIKNGEVSFRVKSLFTTKQNIQKTLAIYGGYIAKENNTGGNDNPSENLILRVPNKNFDKILEQVLIGVEEIDTKNIGIEDVTTQFVDIEARLKNKKQLEAKYQELLVKAGNMDDILKIEKEISVIREDIDAAEGQLNYLSNQVAYSTITLRYYEKRISGFNFGGKMGNALSSGGYGLLQFIIIIVNLWPLWLIATLTWYLGVKLIRRGKNKNNFK